MQDQRGNIFEAPRKREYPMPPLRGTGFTEMMSAAARTLGLHPFPGPAAITSQSYQGRAACVYHGFCNGGGCHVNSKSSTAVSTIPKAQATGRFKWLPKPGSIRLKSAGMAGRAASPILKMAAITSSPRMSSFLRPTSTRTSAHFYCRSHQHIRTVSRTITGRSANTISVTTRGRP